MNADQITRIKEGQLDRLAEYREKLYREPQLRQLFFELTLRCNARCFHCGSSCAADQTDGLPREKYAEILREVKENFDIRRMMLCITGGEPMLRKDFFDIMEDARGLGYRWGMTSNATLITKEAARRLRETGMRTISVSVDGLEATHNALRGMPDGYRQTMTGIRNLIDEGGFKAIQITTVINHENIREMEAMYGIFKDMDIDSWRLVALEPIGRALQRPDLMLTAEDHRALLSFIRERREEQMPVTYGCCHFLGTEWEREVRKWYFLCNAGVYVAGITANGDISACLDIPRNEKTIQGNVYRDRFTDVWRSRFAFFRRPLAERNETCRACPQAKWCAGGSAHSWDYAAERQKVCFKDVLF